MSGPSPVARERAPQIQVRTVDGGRQRLREPRAMIALGREKRPAGLPPRRPFRVACRHSAFSKGSSPMPKTCESTPSQGHRAATPAGMRPVTPIDLEDGIKAAWPVAPGGQPVPIETVFKALAAVVARELAQLSAPPASVDVDDETAGEMEPGGFKVPHGAVCGSLRHYKAGNNIPANRAVLMVDGTDEAVLGFASPHTRIGVAAEGGEKGQSVGVSISGIEEVEVAAPVRAGAYVEVTKGGRIAEAVLKPGYNVACLGKSLAAATATGQRVPVLISPFILVG